MTLGELHLIRPLWLLALPLVVIAGWFLLRIHRGFGDWRNIIDVELYTEFVRATDPGRPGWLDPVLAASVFVIIAMAGPSLDKSERPVALNQAVRVIALDISSSMRAADIAPDRLIRARAVVRSILESSAGIRTALVAYAGDAWTVAPLTRDIKTIENMLAVLDPDIAPVQGSRPDLALTRADQLTRLAGVESAHIILISDGFRGGTPVADIAGKLAARGFAVSVIAAGTARGARIPLPDGGWMRDFKGEDIVARSDMERLAAVATAGGGSFIKINDVIFEPELINRALQRIDAAFVASASLEDEEGLHISWRDDGPWLLLPALLLLALGFRRGWLNVLLLGSALAFGLAPEPAQADMLSWFLRDDQRTARAVASEDYDDAARHVRDSRWRGVIAYRRNDLTAAAHWFAAGDSADDHYNRGNALAMGLQFADAIAAYSTALEREPDHADALHNRALIRKLLEARRERDRQKGDFDDVQDTSDAQGDNESGSNADDQKTANSGNRDDTQSDLNSALSSLADNEQSGDDPNVTPQHREEPPLSPREVEVWLRRVPDDPGGYLRRKFQIQQRHSKRHSGFGQAW